MTTQPPTLLNLAKQGNVEALTILMNHHLHPKGINAKVVINGDCLQILLESTQTPDRTTLLPFIHKGIKGLKLRSINSLKIYARKIGERSLDWSYKIQLNEAERLIEKKNELQHLAEESKEKSNYNIATNKKLANLKSLLKNLWIKFENLRKIEKIVLTLSFLAFIILLNTILDGFQKIENAKYESSNRFNQAVVYQLRKSDELDMKMILSNNENVEEQQLKIIEKCKKYFDNLNENGEIYNSYFLNETCEKYK